MTRNATPTQSRTTGGLDKFVPLPELAKRLGVSERTIARWHTLRTGPRRTKISRSIYYHEDDIALWIDSHREEQP